MNVLKRSLLIGGCVAAFTLCADTSLFAQRNFDPAQFRQMRIDRAREQLEVKDDAEWKAIEPIVGKVVDAQRDLMAGRMGGFRGGRRNNGGSDTNSTDQSGQQRRRTSPFGEPSAAMAALQKAIDDKAPPAELKDKLAAVRAEYKDHEAKLAAAEDELKGVLSSRQEAIAVANGILR